MKSITRTLTTLVCLTIAQLGATCAFAGTGSGNGNGDHAFALSRLAEANPGLSPEQVLLKAFAESEGRIPEVKFDQQCRDGKVPTAQCGTFLPGETGFTLQLGVDDGDPSKQQIVRSNDYVYRKSSSVGPLFPQLSVPMLLVSNSDSEMIFSRPLLTTRTGLYEVLATGNVEYRQYNSKIVVFVTYPVGEGTHKGCLQHKSVNGICSVGYFWAE